jgi:hypothetical protein
MSRMLLIIVLCLCSIPGFGQTVVEDFFTSDGGQSPISLNGGQKCGQHFIATQPFTGIEVNGPTWSVNGEKGMTIRLYSWAGNYADTVAQNPIAVSILVNVDDNGWFPCNAWTELPAGDYFWEASEPTNSNPDATDPFQIGCWLWNESRYAGGEAYFNGEVYDAASLSWVNWFGDGQSGAWTPFSVPDTDIASLAQSFTAMFDFKGVSVGSPTWNGTGAGARLTLYKWDTDYDTTITTTPIAQRTIHNHSDNARMELTWDNAQPGGKYLLVTDLPERGTGNIGHWGWRDSSWWDPDNTAYADGVEMADFVTFEFYIGEESFEPVGKDFASRSVTGTETKVVDWSLFQ